MNCGFKGLTVFFVIRKSPKVLNYVLLCIWAPALRDYASELHLSTSINLEPVLLLLRISTPRTAVNVVLVSWTLIYLQFYLWIYFLYCNIEIMIL